VQNRSCFHAWLFVFLQIMYNEQYRHSNVRCGFFVFVLEAVDSVSTGNYDHVIFSDILSHPHLLSPLVKSSFPLKLL